MFNPVHTPLAGEPSQLDPERIALVGVPVDANSSFLRGTAAGPNAVRAQLHSGSANMTSEAGIDISAVIVDVGDIALDNEVGSTADAATITAACRALLDTGATVVALGGDHSITYPLLTAHAAHAAELTVVQVDEHPDLYDDFGDNRLSHASPFARVLEDGLCSRLTQIGIRATTNGQRAQADRFAVETVPAREISSFDPTTVIGQTYISIDLDAVDPAHAPGVSHHEPGGLTSRDVIDLVAGLPGPIVGADVVELNPSRDVHGMTAMLAAKLTKELAARIVETRGQPLQSRG